ncbi:hypothetical protein ScPMuIL_000934 [Solemya velum]
MKTTLILDPTFENFMKAERGHTFLSSEHILFTRNSYGVAFSVLAGGRSIQMDKTTSSMSSVDSTTMPCQCADGSIDIWQGITTRPEVLGVGLGVGVLSSSFLFCVCLVCCRCCNRDTDKGNKMAAHPTPRSTAKPNFDLWINVDDEGSGPHIRAPVRTNQMTSFQPISGIKVHSAASSTDSCVSMHRTSGDIAGHSPDRDRLYSEPDQRQRLQVPVMAPGRGLSGVLDQLTKSFDNVLCRVNKRGSNVRFSSKIGEPARPRLPIPKKPVIHRNGICECYAENCCKRHEIHRGHNRDSKFQVDGHLLVAEDSRCRHGSDVELTQDVSYIGMEEILNYISEREVRGPPPTPVVNSKNTVCNTIYENIPSRQPAGDRSNNDYRNSCFVLEQDVITFLRGVHRRKLENEFRYSSDSEYVEMNSTSRSSAWR